ncbi:MAG: formylglycine-generating enzyme family protein [Anaerolineae bacterium]|nr:formylglycine-generating enzyme family protein [Anaerolineae bacterium]
MRLGAKDRALLRNAMLDGFTLDTLRQVILRTERRPDYIIRDGATFPKGVDEVIEYAEIHDCIPQLIVVLKAENPTNRLVTALPESFMDHGVRFADAGMDQTSDALQGHRDVVPRPEDRHYPPPAHPADWPAPRIPHREINETRVFATKDDKEMVLVPGGEFQFGTDCVPKNMGPFWIDKTPVTNREYKYFIDDTQDHPVPVYWNKARRTYPEDKANYPVTFVNWHDAMEYAAWAGKFLPTQEQWEKAARGINGRLYPWGNEWCDRRCNTAESGIHHTTHVGRYSPAGDSPYGCVDVSGNVWEWTATRDNSHDRAYVLRGGSWYNDQSDAHVTARIAHNPLGWYPVVGFRLVDRPPELPLPLLNYLLVASNV